VANVSRDIAAERVMANQKHLAGLAEDDPARAFAEEEIGWQEHLLSLAASSE
jgi:hypothetical protein